MKNLFHKQILLSLFFLTTLIGKSQILNENFNSGLPTNWTQSPPTSWSLSPNLGTGGTSCAYFYQAASDAYTNTISTPTLNLSAVTSLTLSFRYASVAKFFVGPDMAVYYDAGAGPQFIARWGTTFNPVTTYTINYNADYQEPLDSQYVEWTNCTHAIPLINGVAVKFIFEAEMVNGGYALLEDIVITGVPTITTSVKSNLDLNYSKIVVSPNPVLNKRIHIKGKEIKTILLFDNLGREVPITYTNIESGIELDITACESGVYFLNVLTDQASSISKKILVE